MAVVAPGLNSPDHWSTEYPHPKFQQHATASSHFVLWSLRRQRSLIRSPSVLIAQALPDRLHQNIRFRPYGVGVIAHALQFLMVTVLGVYYLLCHNDRTRSWPKGKTGPPLMVVESSRISNSGARSVN
jgi:hypothetical protein